MSFLPLGVTKRLDWDESAGFLHPVPTAARGNLNKKEAKGGKGLLDIKKVMKRKAPSKNATQS